MTKTSIAVLCLALSTLARAEGTIDGWVRVHGHQYPVHPVTIRVFEAHTGEELAGLRTENRPDGTYDITGVPDGDYKVHYDAHGEAWLYLDELAGNTDCDNADCNIQELGAVIRIAGDSKTLNTNLMLGVPLGGTVTDDRHTPLQGVTVEFFDEQGEPHCCSRVTDAQGDWSRPVYFPAGYYVVARYDEPSAYRPKVYPNKDCSGCDIVDVGTEIFYPYYTAYFGINAKLVQVEPDPAIAIEDVAPQKYSGSWFNPERDGEGFIVEVLDRPAVDGDGQEVVVFWFTYGPDGKQAWMVGTGSLTGRVADVEFEITSGASFGAGFNAEEVARKHWGGMRLEFLNCSRAHAQYAGEFGSGQLDLNRLSAIEGLDCDDPDGAVVSGNPALSGAWFNPARDGEGFILEFVDDSQLLTYWFTYDSDGSQMWLLGLGEVDAAGQAMLNMQRATGGRFGDQFDPQDVQLEDWGQLSFQFDDCSEASYGWFAAAPYGSGGFDIGRLTVLKDTDC